MPTFRRAGFAGCLAVALAASGLASAADPPSEREQAEEMAREAIQRMMRALELLIESIPQYEMPELTEDGDIIIRRKRQPAPGKPDEPELDSTKT